MIGQFLFDRSLVSNVLPKTIHKEKSLNLDGIILSVQSQRTHFYTTTFTIKCSCRLLRNCACGSKIIYVLMTCHKFCTPTKKTKLKGSSKQKYLRKYKYYKFHFLFTVKKLSYCKNLFCQQKLPDLFQFLIFSKEGKLTI